MLLRQFLWEAASQSLRAAESMHVQTQQPFCLWDSSFADAGRSNVASKPSQTNLNRPAACLLLPKSSQFGELEQVDIFMTNPFGEFGVLEKMRIESAPGTAFFLVHQFALDRFKQFSMESPESSSHASICRLVQVAVLVWWQGFGMHWKDYRGLEFLSSYCRQACDLWSSHIWMFWQLDRANLAKTFVCKHGHHAFFSNVMPNLTFGAGRSCRKHPVGSFDKHSQHVNAGHCSWSCRCSWETLSERRVHICYTQPNACACRLNYGFWFHDTNFAGAGRNSMALEQSYTCTDRPICWSFQESSQFG